MTFFSNIRFTKDKTHSTGKLAQLGLCFTGAVLLAGCGGSNDSSKKTTTNTGQVSVSVTPKNANAVLMYNNLANSNRANTAGYARLANLPESDRLVLNVGAYGYALQTMVEKLAAAQNRSLVAVNLLKLNAADKAYDSTKAGSFTTAKKATVTVAANTLQRADGGSLDKTVTVSVTDVDVSDETLLPKSFTSKSTSANGSTVYTPLEMLAAVHVQMQENEANVITTAYALAKAAGLHDFVELKSGSTYSVSIPVAGQTASSADLYAFNISTAVWEKAGTLRLNAAKTAYEGKTSKTGYLAVAKPISNTATLTGCVADAAASNTKLAGVEVILTGENYSGYSKAITDKNGKFTLTAKAGSNVNLLVKSGQYKATAIQLNNASTQTLNGGNCYSLDIGTSDIKAAGKLTWQGNKDYDINVILPNKSAMFYNARRYVDANTVTTEITENKDAVSENITYKKLMVGKHYLFVNNFYNNYSTPMSKSGTRFVFHGQTFTPPAGEVSTSTSQLIDTRTPVWLAAVMTVDENCKVTVTAPSSSEYKVWLRDYEFARGEIMKNGETLTASTGKFCTAS